MVVTKAPLLLIINDGKNGKHRLLVEGEKANESSVQFHYVFRGLLSGLEIIDASGNYFSDIRVETLGIDWKLYLRSGLIGLVVLLFSILFGVVMVRVKFFFERPQVLISLDELKTKVCNAIRDNPNYYSYCPHAEIIRRVSRSQTIASLIEEIVKD